MSDPMKPMKLEVYNSFVEDFNKLTSYSRKAETELKKKYKHLPASTFGSLFSLLVQRAMKQTYRKSPSISSKYGEMYESLTSDKYKGNRITQVCSRQWHGVTLPMWDMSTDKQGFEFRVSGTHNNMRLRYSKFILLHLCLADSLKISPALFARSLVQNVYPDSTMAKKCIKDTTLIEDKDLAYEVFLGIMNDNQYGPYADVIKQSIGLEYELKLENELKAMNITFTDENILRIRGYDKTPDFKLDVPIAVGDFVINWIESKALFGDEENHSGYLKDQLMCYWNRFGPGLVIYWFGYLETLDLTPEVNNMFILRSSFPPKESITLFKYDSY